MARSTNLFRYSAFLAFGVSILTAGAAVAWIARLLWDYEAKISQLGAEDVARAVDVAVVKHKLEPGHVIEQADLEVVQIDQTFVPDTVMLDPAEIVGRTAVERILPREFVRRERLAPPAAGQGLNALIPNGMRAISLDFADDQQVSGFVEPGDGVDLLVTLPPPQGQTESETITLVQGAAVLTVNNSLQKTLRGEEIRRQQVTLAIAPDVIEKVTHALEVGRAKLTLRSEIDFTHVEVNGARASSLLGRDTSRLTVAQWRERVTDADLARMVEIVHGHDKVREAVIDPDLLRPPR